MSLRLLFLDVDDTILAPPHRAMSRVAALMGIKRFPTEQELTDRSDIEYYKAFASIFKSRSRMWKMALAAIPFGFVRCQNVLSGIDVEKLAAVLADKRVFLVSQNPPFLAKARVRHLKNLFGVDLTDRYIACGPIKGKSPSKAQIVTCIRKLYGVAAQDCLLIDDSRKHIDSVRAVGVTGRLIDAAWNKPGGDEDLLPHAQLHRAAEEFLAGADALPKTAGRRASIDLALSSAARHSLLYFSSRFALAKLAPPLAARPLGPAIFKFDEVSVKTPYGFRLVCLPSLSPNLNHIKAALGELDDGALGLTEAYSKQELVDELTAAAGGDAQAGGFARELASGRSALGVKVLYWFYAFLIKIVFRNVNVHCRLDLKAIGKDNFVLFIPQHRSIYDSSLLMHVVASKAGTMPIIPAALKMKKNIVGVWGQLIGTFYIRREKVSETYSALTRDLIRFSLNNSSSAAIFVEGQRSRSGLPLPPKAGVFKLFLEQAARCGVGRIAIVPIAFAYNQLPEAEVLADQVLEERRAGNVSSPQEQSDILIRRHSNRFVLAQLAGRILRRRVSEAYVSFGQPIFVDAHAKQQLSREAVQALLAAVMAGSNAAVPPLASSIGSLAVTSEPSRHQKADSLVHFLNLSNLLIRVFPKAEYAGVQGSNRRDFFDELNALPFINRKFKARGIRQSDFVSITDLDIVLAGHYRNNVVHYFALPGLLAWLIEIRYNGEISDLRGEFLRYAPAVEARLFIPRDADLNVAFRKILAIFALTGAVVCDAGLNSYSVKVQSSESPFLILSRVGRSLFEELGFVELGSATRRSDRLDISVPVRVSRTDGRTHKGKVLNLSKTGGECAIDAAIAVGETVEIVFDASSSAGTKLARVVRKTRRGFGFAFERTGQGAATAVDYSLQKRTGTDD